jgi:predicted MFS family arabinose efflux permease
MGAFALASIAGIPLGLALANTFEWHAPFYAIVVVSSLAFVLAFKVLPPLAGHLESPSGNTPWQGIRVVLSERVHQWAFLLVVCIMFGGFSVIPFISPYLVANVGVSEGSLHYIYLCGGAATLLTSPLIGRLADAFGNLRVFASALVLSIFPILVLTRLPVVPLWVALSVTTCLMILTSGRVVVAINMVNSALLPAYRGSFMSINASVQQMSAGLASFGASLLVTSTPGSPIQGYATVGVLAAGFSLAALAIAPRVKRLGPSST